jgi:hypothetical protein
MTASLRHISYELNGEISCEFSQERPDELVRLPDHLSFCFVSETIPVTISLDSSVDSHTAMTTLCATTLGRILTNNVSTNATVKSSESALQRYLYQLDKITRKSMAKDTVKS